MASPRGLGDPSEVSEDSIDEFAQRNNLSPRTLKALQGAPSYVAFEVVRHSLAGEDRDGEVLQRLASAQAVFKFVNDAGMDKGIAISLFAVDEDVQQKVMQQGPSSGPGSTSLMHIRILKEAVAKFVAENGIESAVAEKFGEASQSEQFNVMAQGPLVTSDRGDELMQRLADLRATLMQKQSALQNADPNIQRLFTALDTGKDLILNAEELLKYAILCEFDQVNEWFEEYSFLCESRSWNPAVGCDAEDFAELVSQEQDQYYLYYSDKQSGDNRANDTRIAELLLKDLGRMNKNMAANPNLDWYQIKATHKLTKLLGVFEDLDFTYPNHQAAVENLITDTEAWLDQNGNAPSSEIEAKMAEVRVAKLCLDFDLKAMGDVDQVYKADLNALIEEVRLWLEDNPEASAADITDVLNQLAASEAKFYLIWACNHHISVAPAEVEAILRWVEENPDARETQYREKHAELGVVVEGVAAKAEGAQSDTPPSLSSNMSVLPSHVTPYDQQPSGFQASEDVEWARTLGRAKIKHLNARRNEGGGLRASGSMPGSVLEEEAYQDPTPSEASERNEAAYQGNAAYDDADVQRITKLQARARGNAARRLPDQKAAAKAKKEALTASGKDGSPQPMQAQASMRTPMQAQASTRTPMQAQVSTRSRTKVQHAREVLESNRLAREKERDAAALKLQTVYRGHAAREHVKAKSRRPSVILVELPWDTDDSVQRRRYPKVDISKWGMSGTGRVRHAETRSSSRPGSPPLSKWKRPASPERLAAEAAALRIPGSPRGPPRKEKQELVTQWVPQAWPEGVPTHDMEELRGHMRERRGCCLRAWRFDVDRSGTGFATFQDFESCCDGYNCEGDAPHLWDEALEPGASTLDFSGLAKGEATNVVALLVVLHAKKISLEEAWGMLNTSMSSFCTLEDFVSGCAEQFAFTGDAALIYTGLDASGEGRLWYNDFEYLGVLYESLKGTWNMPEAGNLVKKRPMELPKKDPRTSEYDLEAGAEFLRFAQHHWPSIVELFQEDKFAATAKRQYRAVLSTDFDRWMRNIGFRADPHAVVREVHREFARNGNHFGALSEDVQPRDVDPERISLPQVQCFRHVRVALARKRLVTTMKYRRGNGSVLRCWRLDLDKDGDGVASKAQFQKAALVLACDPDVDILWSALRPDGDTDPLELWDFSPNEAADLQQFGALLMNRARFDLNDAWKILDSNRVGSANYTEFRRACQDIGFTGNTMRLFRGLDAVGKGEIWSDSLDPAWVMCLTNAMPSKRASRRQQRMSKLAATVEEPVKLDLDLLLRRLCLDKKGSSQLGDRVYLRRLEDCGFEGPAAQPALKLARCLTKGRDIAGGVVQPPVSSDNRPAWDYSDVVRVPRPVPLKYSKFHPAIDARMFARPGLA